MGPRPNRPKPQTPEAKLTAAAEVARRHLLSNDSRANGRERDELLRSVLRPRTKALLVCSLATIGGKDRPWPTSVHRAYALAAAVSSLGLAQPLTLDPELLLPQLIEQAIRTEVFAADSDPRWASWTALGHALREEAMSVSSPNEAEMRAGEERVAALTIKTKEEPGKKTINYVTVPWGPKALGDDAKFSPSTISVLSSEFLRVLRTAKPDRFRTAAAGALLIDVEAACEYKWLRETKTDAGERVWSI